MAPFDSDEELHDAGLKRKMRGYGGAMVATSLGSESSFRMPSPVRSPARRRVVASSDSSLDELIDSFRASASSLNFSASHTSKAPRSPTKAASAAPKHKSILRRAREPTTSSDEEVAGVSPMPKLTYIPKAKPTLAISAPKKPTLVSGIKPPSRFMQPHNRKPEVQSKLKSPVKLPTRRPVKKAASPPSPVASSLSNQSTTSSLLEEIDAPDSESNQDEGETSIDDLIAHDISKLNRLVSQSQEWTPVGTRRSQTSDDISRQLQQSTRFRRDRHSASGEDDGDAQPRSRTSSFRLFAPESSVRLEPVRSVLHRTGLTSELDLVMNPRDDDDSFAEELRRMKTAAVKEKSKKVEEEAQVKKKKADEEETKKKASEAIGAGLSLRDCVDTIDKDLLLALRPFEKMKQELDKEEAQGAAAEAKANLDLDIPMATQSIVERLEQAFGGQTRQREAEMKAEEDAVAAAKAAEEAKQKEEEDKKSADEAARKQQEREILSLIPMHGRLMTTQDDVYDALARLEHAETLAHESIYHRRAPEQSIEREMEALRAFTMQRVREIEGNMHAMPSTESVASRAVDWHRERFAMDTTDVHDADMSDSQPTENTDNDWAFPDVVRSEVVEKLEFTILKLKHALSVDKKEAAEMEQRRKVADEEAKRASAKKDEEARVKARVEADAAAARQRVMGMASLEELMWVTEADARLEQRLQHSRATERLEDSLAARMKTQDSHRGLRSFLDDSRAAERFDQVKMMMEAPYLLKIQQPSFIAHQAPQRQSPYGGKPTKNATFWRSQALDNQRYDAHEEWVESRQSVIPQQLTSPRSPQTYTRHDVRYRRDVVHDRQQTEYSPPPPLSPQPDKWKVSHIGQASPTRSHKRRGGDKLQELKRAMHDLQADRREKTHWFQSSTRHR